MRISGGFCPALCCAWPETCCWGWPITTRAFSAAGSCWEWALSHWPTQGSACCSRWPCRADRASHCGTPPAPLAALAVTAACARHKRFKLRRMHMELPALAYSLCVGLMCARGTAFGFACGGRRGALAAVGAALFLISDAVLLFVYFYVRPRKALRAVNLAAYYLGMLCLALSV